MEKNTQHSGHGQAVTGFHKRLKEGTQALHDQAESGGFQIRMVRGQITRDELSSFLGQMGLVHEVLDPALVKAAELDQRVDAIFDMSHLRSERIHSDLQDLSSSCEFRPLPATQKFREYVTGQIESDPVSLIGALYVKEGATNGNKFIAKGIRENLDLEDHQAMGYLDPHGKDQRRKWNQFKEQLNQLDLTESEQESCLDVARETFRMVMNISSELHSHSTVPSS